MMKQILEAEITYYLDNDTFFPLNIGDTIVISHNSALNNPADITQVTQALKIIIPEGHNLDFTFQRLPDLNGIDAIWVTISSYNNSFPLHSGGTFITEYVNRNGQFGP